MKKNNKNKKRGITLIALIVTIIVLLILAGVGIGFLTGENGILTKTNETKVETERATFNEKVELSILASRINKKYKINLTELEQELKNNIGEGLGINKLGENGNLPWEVTYKDYTYYIDEEGYVEEANGISLSRTKLTMVQGQSETITAIVTKAEKGTIEWESSNPSLATVTNGTITAIGTSGEVIITARLSGTSYSAECVVTIVSKVTNIVANDIQVDKGFTKKLNVVTTPSNNVEQLQYESNNESIAKVDDQGQVTGISEGTATITISGTISTNVKTTCTVTVTKPQGAPTGDYVEYNVTYTDMNTNYAFSATNGWRILDGGTPNGDGTYSGVKLIATGIPAKLYYSFETGTNGQTIGDQNKPIWWGQKEHVESLYGTKYSEAGYIASKSGYPNYYAAAGLFKNFASIIFKKTDTPTWNEGGYRAINGKTSGELSGNEFLANGAEEVHNLTLEEMNRARNFAENSLNSIGISAGDTGMFYLRGLKDENPVYGYSNPTISDYWIASPNSNNSHELRYISGNGYIYTYMNHTIGVRPVISLKAKIYNNGSVWKILEQ